MKKIVLAIFLLSNVIYAQNENNLSYYLPQDIDYNKEIPKPQEVIGYNVGEWHVSHDKLIQYMYALAKASDRITIENRGFTFEGRPLVLLTVTSSENHNNIERIKKQHVEATETNSTDFENRPLVLYQGFSIHGNEPSGSNSALLLAYYLAAAKGDKINSILKNSIILLDPSLNPDGLQRFAYWANTNKSINLNPDSNDREFNEVWPRGRSNHYWFDLNRDWLAVQLPESRARIKTFHSWYPNIQTDHHEMGTNSTFFFQPGVQSRVHPLTPKQNQELTKKISLFHAKALDKIGSLYFTEERFDDFYYGKGSTYPDINGAIGILFEQASSRGHLQESNNGLLSFPFSIKNQFTTALSTIDAGLSLKKELLTYQHNFFENSRKEAKKNKNKGIIFGDEKDAAKTFHLAEILKRHKIKIHELKEDLNENGVNFKKGYSFIVPKNQKNAHLLDAMFEKRTKFVDSLFYDISAWSFQLAFNVDFADDISLDNAGKEIEELHPKKGSVTGKSDYAYLLEWHEYYSPRLLNTLLKDGVRAKVGMKPFTLNSKDYDYGTLLIPVQNQKLNATELHNYLKILSQNNHVQIDAVDTGLTEGIDLGSNEFKTLEMPKIALIVGDGISSYDAGEIWHLFDTRYNISITKIDTRNLERIDLTKYNTLILPSSNLDDNKTTKIKTWIENGGTLIAYRNALKWLKSKKLAKIDLKKMELIGKDISFEQQRNFRGAQVIGGAIFEAQIDRSHPINFGYKNDKISLFRNTTIFMNPDKNSYNNPIKYTKNPIVSGYISKQNLDSISGTVPLQIKRLKKGKIVAFTDNTNFRAFWYGTNKLLMNAIFFREEL